MEFELLPPEGVGGLRIGMPRNAVGEVLADLRDSSVVCASDQPGRHIFRPSGLMVSVHCAGGVLQAVEIGRPTDASDTVRFRDVDVFALPALEVVARVGKYAVIWPDRDDPASYIAPDLLLSFWRPFAADDEPGEEQGYCFSSVLLARPGYYDTPAEAEAEAKERLRRSSQPHPLSTGDEPGVG